jgi:hypothetical protein
MRGLWMCPDSSAGSANAWPGRGVRVLLLVGMLGLFLVPLPWAEDRMTAAWMSALHVPAFFVLGRIGLPAGARACGGRVLGLVGLTLLVEGAQQATGRDASWLDVGYGVCGIGVAVGWLYVRARQAFVGSGVLLVLAGVVMMSGPALVGWDRARMEAAFPELEGFEGWLSRGRWQVEGLELRQGGVTPPDATGAGWWCQLAAGTRYPGLFMTDFVRDWSAWQRLVVRCYVAGEEPLTTWIRIDDREAPPYADRFQQVFLVEPGWQSIVVDLEALQTESGRRMDQDRIATWGIFWEEEAQGRQVWLERAWLE